MESRGSSAAPRARGEAAGGLIILFAGLDFMVSFAFFFAFSGWPAPARARGAALRRQNMGGAPLVGSVRRQDFSYLALGS